MRGQLVKLALGVLLFVCMAAPAQAATVTFSDVPAASWAHNQITWSATNGWVLPRTVTSFGPKKAATRMAAARVLARLALIEHGTAVAANPYTEAVTAGWILPGTGADQQIQQWEFDRGILRVMNLMARAQKIGHLETAEEWRPKLPFAFGIEQAVRALGARVNAPDGSDSWETWPTTPMRRLNLAVQAFALGHLSAYARQNVIAKTTVVHALPAWSPLRQQVLGMALKYAGAPYVWAGEWPTTASPYGTQAAGGFDCSGFVWWVLKEHTYRLPNGFTWSGNAAIQARSTYDMAAALPIAKRIPYAKLRPGDILFWSSAPKGVNTASATVYHTGIYLGKSWTINSHGSGDGVTLDYMGSGAGWYRDAFAFGWRVLPAGR
jgi:cell wall-associated NlpC family hydrolase